MKFLKTEFAVQSNTCWTLLKMWDQMKSAFVPYFFSLTGRQQIATEIVRKCNQVHKSMQVKYAIANWVLSSEYMEIGEITDTRKFSKIVCNWVLLWYTGLLHGI
jgi:hypothetical protein